MDMSAKKISRLSRQRSFMDVEANPLETGQAAETVDIKVENLTLAIAITSDKLTALIGRLVCMEENEERLKLLDAEKEPFLFSSSDLEKLVGITPSIKTKIAMFHMIGPRLIDPKANIPGFTSMFRFSEEKSIIEEILKARANTLAAGSFVNPHSPVSPSSHVGRRSPLASAGRVNGRGRGGAGRGRGFIPAVVPSAPRAVPSASVTSPDDVSSVFGFEKVGSVSTEGAGTIQEGNEEDEER